MNCIWILNEIYIVCSSYVIGNWFPLCGIGNYRKMRKNTKRESDGEQRFYFNNAIHEIWYERIVDWSSTHIAYETNNASHTKKNSFQNIEIVWSRDGNKVNTNRFEIFLHSPIQPSRDVIRVDWIQLHSGNKKIPTVKHLITPHHTWSHLSHP